MANAFTPLELHVNAITESLAQNRADVRVGEQGQHQWGSPRRVLFEPKTGALTPSEQTGKLEVFTGLWAKPFKTIPLQVTAHIVAENHSALWVLWQNVVIASHKSLKLNSIPGDFNLNPETLEAASHLHDGAKYLTQDFTWKFVLFDTIIDLPDYTEEVTKIVGTGDLYPLEDFTNEVDVTEEPIGTEGEA